MGDSLNGKWCAREEEIQETERITQLPGRISNLKYPRLYVSHEVVDPLSSSIQKKKLFHVKLCQFERNLHVYAFCVNIETYKDRKNIISITQTMNHKAPKGKSKERGTK